MVCETSLGGDCCVQVGFMPLARWSSSLGHCPPSHHLLFRISNLLFSCSCNTARLISSLKGEPERENYADGGIW